MIVGLPAKAGAAGFVVGAVEAGAAGCVAARWVSDGWADVAIAAPPPITASSAMPAAAAFPIAATRNEWRTERAMANAPPSPAPPAAVAASDDAVGAADTAGRAT